MEAGLVGDTLRPVLAGRMLCAALVGKALRVVWLLPEITCCVRTDKSNGVRSNKSHPAVRFSFIRVTVRSWVATPLPVVPDSGCVSDDRITMLLYCCVRVQ